MTLPPLVPIDTLSRGKQIVYIPDHAKGDITHPDVDFGFITSWNSREENGVREWTVFCRYYRKHEPGKLRTTANSEATNKRDLYNCESVPQYVVDALLWLIEKDRL